MPKNTPRLVLSDEQRAIVAQIRAEIERDRPEFVAEGQLVFDAAQALAVELRSVFALLKSERKRQGVSLTELSARTGIGKPALSRLENDPAPNVQLTTLQRYVAALGRELRISLAEPKVRAPRRRAAIARNRHEHVAGK